MSGYPVFELIESSVKSLFRWFFVTFLFCTREMQAEAELYFETGTTSFRHFEWLSPTRVRRLYPGRWKFIIADFAGAYLKLGSAGAIFIAFIWLIVQGSYL